MPHRRGRRRSWTWSSVCSCQAEKHLVERRAAQTDVIDADPVLVEQSDGFGQLTGPGRPARRRGACRRRRGARRRRCRRGRSATSPMSASRCGRTSTTSRPALDLSSSGVPAAITRPLVDDHDVARQLVGLLEVLRGEQHVGAIQRPARGSSSTAPGGCVDRARWSARPATAGAAGRRGWRRDRVAGAFPPSTCARAGRRHPSGGGGRARHRRRAGRPGRRGRTAGRS